MTEVKLQDYAPDFLDHLDENYRHNTARNYRYAVLDFLEYLDQTGETIELTPEKVYSSADIIKTGYYKTTDLHEVKTNAIRRLLEYIGKEKMPTKEQDMLDSISSLVTYSKVSAEDTSTELTPQEVKEKLLTQSEVDAITETCDLYQLVIFKILMDTGCRIGEITAAKIDDYDFEPSEPGVDCVLRITKTYVSGLGIQNVPKSKAGRRPVELKQESAELLQDYIAIEEKGEDDLLFGTIQTMRRKLEAAFVEAGVRVFEQDNQKKTEFTPHWLRHNTATRLVKQDNDLDLEDIRRYMGWETIAMLKVYTHFDESDIVGVHV